MAEYAHPEVLVSTEWVEQHCTDPNVRLIEVDVDTSAYSEGHIPGAVAFDWTSQLQDQVRRDVATREQAERLLREAGVNAGDTVIFYGDNNNWFAAYAYWMFNMYGLQNARIMNGGRKKWLEENRELTKDVPKPATGNITLKEHDESIRARRDDVLKALGGTNNVALVDVRSPAEYKGEVIAPPGMTETAQRAGHIPGARNIPWAQAANDDGTFKSPDELRKLYAEQGITPEKEVIAYCRIGERSSHTWFALHELLGYGRVRNYDGSWTEWGSMVDVPVER